MKYSAWILLLLLVIMIAVSGCGGIDREYLPDLVVPLEDAPGQIVIKEWQFLQGSGAEIYYQMDSELTLLGKIGSGDDGYCPFKFGTYAITVEENVLIVSWAFRPGTPRGEWRENRFFLPE